MIQVQSSYLDAVEYDAATSVLKIRFKRKDGRITGTATYLGVDPTRAFGLLNAPSKGSYFHSSGLSKRPYTWRGA